MAYKENFDSNVSIVEFTQNHSIYYDYDNLDPLEYCYTNRRRIFYLSSIGFPVAIFLGVLANISLFSLEGVCG